MKCKFELAVVAVDRVRSLFAVNRWTRAGALTVATAAVAVTLFCESTAA
jgi:hypothetical protein